MDTNKHDFFLKRKRKKTNYERRENRFFEKENKNSRTTGEHE